MRAYFCILLTFTTLAACDTGSQRPIETSQIQEEMQRREIRHIKEGDLATAALKEGRQLADTAQAALLNRLQTIIAERGITEAVEYCSTAALPLLDSVASEGVNIRRTSLRIRNPKDAPDTLEYQLLDAYAYSAENQQQLNDNLQPLGDTAYLYTKPIMMASPLCLNCHGTENEIAAETRQRLMELYPKDEATGYALGDFRGMWSIKIPKKYLVGKL